MGVGLLGALTARADDKAAAIALFDEAKALADNGQFAAACPKYQASYQADPELGVLLHLADCHQQVGKLATAWAEFRDVEDEAASKHDASRQQYAHDHALALLPRLVRLQVKAPAIAGLVVRRDGVDITASLGVGVPVDPGTHAIVASAPGYVEWSKTIETVGEGKLVPVEIPQLDSATAPKNPAPPVEPITTTAPTPPPQPAATTPTVVEPAQPPSDLSASTSDTASRSSNALPLALGGGVVALMGGALAFDLSGDSTYSQAKAETSSQSLRDSLYDSANVKRGVAVSLAVAGVGCASAAVWFFLRGRHTEHRQAASAIVISPTGLAVTGDF